MVNKPLIIFILGPTGVGKSDFAIRLAKKINGEIISCDSMQIYNGMSIISQQPTAKLCKEIPHHLVGILSPSKEWDVANFIKKANKIAEDIVKRNGIPVVVGGTGLYARAFIKGLFPSPPRDKRLRKALYEEAIKKGKKKLYEKLLKIDPTYASKIHPNDLRRIIRALEVFELTGKPISQKQTEAEGIEARYNILIFILTRNRKELYRRIDEHVERMFAKGIINEVKRLKKQKISQTAEAVLGYKEVSDYIGKKYSLQRAKELLKRNTRHYAKRQLTWFRREENAKWLELLDGREYSKQVNTIAKEVLRRSTVDSQWSID